MMKIWAVAIVGSVLLSGCASVDNHGTFREYDLRNERYQYVDTNIHMELPAVQRQLFIHKKACDVEVMFRKDPRQVHFATVIYGPAGSTDLKDQIMFDLTAYTTGKLAIKGYSYYVDNKDLARQFVKILGNPTTCPQGISPKTE